MEFDEVTIKFLQIFCPGQLEQRLSVVSEQKKFVYYTSADTAMKVLCNRELWFRNATALNDFSEISYGMELCRNVLDGQEGQRFQDAVEDIFPGTIKLASNALSGWVHDWQFETYLACVSIHRPEEDQRGRLSMWRAYGDTAIVVNNTPMTAVSDTLAVFSIPVQYLSEAELKIQLALITDSILINRKYLIGLGV